MASITANPGPEQAEELICIDCGAIFVSHGASDGLEQLCNDCYAAQFTSQRATKTAGLEILAISSSSLQAGCPVGRHT
jgi:hypothetical protein